MPIVLFLLKLASPLKILYKFLRSPQTIAFIAKHWKLFLIGVLGAYVFWQAQSHASEINGKNETILTQEMTISDLQSANTNLIKAVELQNVTIIKYQEAGEILKGHVQAATDRIKNQEVKIQELLDDLSRKPPPKDCEGAMKWMIQKAKDNFKWENI